MATAWSTIITDAINRSLMNNQGTTPLAQDSAELLRVGGRLMRKVYQRAALPRPLGDQRGNFFVTSDTVTIATPNTTLVALPASPEIGHIIQITDNAGTPVAAIGVVDLRQGRAEIPPAVIVQNGKIKSAARTGDPAAGAVLTLEYAYIAPGPNALTDFVGATTLADATTTAWPIAIANQWLIDSLAVYLATKDERPVHPEIKASLAEHAQLLGDLLGVNLAKLQLVEDA